MRKKLVLGSILAALLASATPHAHAQVEAGGSRFGSRLVAGAGFSNFAIDYRNGNRMNGLTAWIDWAPNHMPTFLNGVAVELEARDIRFNRPSTLPTFRYDTALGGFTYHWNHYRRVKPFGRFLLGIGGVTFPPAGSYSHDTRTVYAPGGGVDYYATSHVVLRADYEYQVWPVLLSRTRNPNGFTFSVGYDFGGNSQ